MIGEAGASDAGALEPLVARAQAADRDGIQGLLQRVRPLVLRWAMARTGDVDDAEDVAQMVLMRVHEHIGTFDARSRFTTWLYRITANATAELHRRRAARSRAAERARDHAPEQPLRDPLQRIEDERTRELLRLMLEELSDQQRAVLDLVDLQGFSPAEAAEMTGMNPNTLRVHLFRARKSIRSRILNAGLKE